MQDTATPYKPGALSAKIIESLKTNPAGLNASEIAGLVDRETSAINSWWCNIGSKIPGMKRTYGGGGRPKKGNAGRIAYSEARTAPACQTTVAEAAKTKTTATSSAPAPDTAVNCHSWQARPKKQITRALIALDNIERSQRRPLHIFSLVGANFETERFLHASGVKIARIVGVEHDKGVYGQIRRNIRTLPAELQGTTKVLHGSDKQFLLIQGGTGNKVREGGNLRAGFDIVWLDYCNVYGPGVRQSIHLLADNSVMHRAPFQQHGEFRLYLTLLTHRIQETRETLQDLRAFASIPELAAQNPAVPTQGLCPEDAGRLTGDYLRAFGIHYEVATTFAPRAMQAENTHSVYYRDGSSIMLFMGFRITPMDNLEMLGRPLAPQEPAFLGFEKFAQLPHTKKWLETMTELGAIAPELEKHEEAYLYTIEVLKEAGRTDEEIIDVLAPYLPQEKTCGALKGCCALKPAPHEPEPDERAILMQAVLETLAESGNSGATAEKLETEVTRKVPFAEAQAEKTLKSHQSQLRNRIAFAKADLTRGGYTATSKNGAGQTVVRLTGRGEKLAGNNPGNNAGPTKAWRILVANGKL